MLVNFVLSNFEEKMLYLCLTGFLLVVFALICIMVLGVIGSVLSSIIGGRK